MNQRQAALIVKLGLTDEQIGTLFPDVAPRHYGVVREWGAKQGKGKAKATPKAENAATGQKSGLVPEGDVRLTANIREDLHLKLKIEAAKRSTTVGELIEQLIERL